MKIPTFEQFQKDTSAHELEIIQDNDLFRHLKISKPRTGNMHFNITTWPGYLCISGDMGTFVFSRIPDMFDFFRGKAEEINPQYWEEKLCAGAGLSARNVSREYDPGLIYERLDEELKTFIEWQTDEKPQLWQENIEDAKKAVQHFKDWVDSSEYEMVYHINNWDEEEAGGMDLQDFWDGYREAYSYHYVWCCYAIVHAIRLYDETKVAQAA